MIAWQGCLRSEFPRHRADKSGERDSIFGEHVDAVPLEFVTLPFAAFSDPQVGFSLSRLLHIEEIRASSTFQLMADLISLHIVFHLLPDSPPDVQRVFDLAEFLQARK